VGRVSPVADVAATPAGTPAYCKQQGELHGRNTQDTPFIPDCPFDNSNNLAVRLDSRSVVDKG
jgi:hypothetical protein